MIGGDLSAQSLFASAGGCHVLPQREGLVFSARRRDRPTLFL